MTNRSGIRKNSDGFNLAPSGGILANTATTILNFSPMESIDLQHYLMVGAVLFVSGVLCMATKRNAIGVLMGVELVLNGANVNFVAFAYYTPLGLDGQVISLFVIVLAAAEAAVALAIALNFYNNHLTIDVDRGDELKG
jgi:NADH-quinone oxidoreductase subunit K